MGALKHRWYSGAVGDGLGGGIWDEIHLMDKKYWNIWHLKEPGSSCSPTVVPPSRVAKCWVTVEAQTPPIAVSGGACAEGHQQPDVSSPSSPQPLPGRPRARAHVPNRDSVRHSGTQATPDVSGRSRRWGTRSGDRFCGEQRSWAAGRASLGRRSGDVGRTAANMRFWHTGGEPAARGRSRGSRAGPTAPRPLPGEPAGPEAVSEAPLGWARVLGRPVRGPPFQPL